MKARHLALGLRIAVAVLSILFIVYYFYHHRQEMRNVVKLSGPDLGALIFMNAPIIVLHSFKILLTYRFLGLRIDGFRWFRIFIVSRFLNFHVLQGANIYRSFILKRDYGFSYTRSVGLIGGLVLLEAMTILTFSVWILSARLAFLSRDPGAAPTGTWETVVFLTLLLVAIASFPRLFQSVLRSRSAESLIRCGWFSRIRQVADYLSEMSKSRGLVLRYFGVSFLIMALYTPMVWVCFQTFEVPLGWGKAALFTVFMIMTRSFNIIPGNLGLAEVGCGLFAGVLGGNLGDGIAISGIFRVLGYFVTACLAVLFLKDFWKSGLSMKNVRDRHEHDMGMEVNVI